MSDLIRALQRLIDPFYHGGNAVCRIKTLVRIHVSGKIRVGCDLPTAHVNRFQSGADLLHRLVAGERAECVDERLGLKQLPEFLRAAARQCVFDHDAALQTLDIA